jgi:thiol-disulfide isomerase/thioredoxin
MDLYAGPHLLNRWGRVPNAVAGRLDAVAETALARDPEGARNPGALICRALAATADRDRKGRLTAGAAETIEASLTAVLDTGVDGPMAATAIDGLVRTAYETGRDELARTAFRTFVADRAGDPTLIDDVRARLGPLGLRAGGLPEFVATALDGTAVSDEGLRGKVVVVDFWATWCGPCVDQIPDLRRIAERHGPDVAMIGVSLDDADMMPPSALREWVEREGVPGRQLYDGEGWDSRLVRAFGVRQIPFSVVVAADGSVVAVDPSRRELSKAVRSAIASKDQLAGI